MFVGGKDHLRALVQAKLRSIQKSRRLIQSFFHLPDTQYANSLTHVSLLVAVLIMRTAAVAREGKARSTTLP